MSSPIQAHITMLPSPVLPESPSPKCPLLSLPPEIRLRIYDELFQVRKARLCLGAFCGSWYRIDNTKSDKPKTRTPGQCIGILATCKQIFAEAQPVLCANVPLALYYCDINPMLLEAQSVDMTNIVPNTPKVYIRTDFYEMQNLTHEEVRTILAPFVEVANDASRARELKIDLTIGRVRGQQCLDRVTTSLRNIESNAKISMCLNMIGGSDFRLNDEGFTELLKKFLKVDETSKVWQTQLEWEKERHAYLAGRLPKIKDKLTRRNSEFELLCAAAGLSPMIYYHRHMASSDVQLYQGDYAKLLADEEWCMECMRDSKTKITDLEQKLRLMASS